MAKKSAKPSSAIDAQLNEFEAKVGEIAKLRAQAEAVTKKIRSGTVDSVLVFIDMVGSTQFKLEHASDPETWILRVRQFDVFITEYVEAAGGRVVKYIGDEVMAAFEGDEAVDNAIGLVNRVATIEKKLTELTGAPTRVKIAMDRGPVYLLELPGNHQPDPQGTPVDRCARIGKFTEPGTVLASYEVVERSPLQNWSLIGELPMKGLGNVSVYQLGPKTVAYEARTEIPVRELEGLRRQLSESQKKAQGATLENARLIEMNHNLQAQLEEAGATPNDGDTVQTEEESGEQKDWASISEEIAQIKKLMNGSPVPNSDYAKFLFSAIRDEGREYNQYEGQTFDEMIKADLVYQRDDERFYLDEDHPRNRKLLNLCEALDGHLKAHEETYGTSDDHLFNYTLHNSETWSELLDFSV